MVRTGNRIAYSAIGAVAGLTGTFALGRCGGACGTCLGCAAAGLAVVAAALVQRLVNNRDAAMEGSDDGLA